MVEEGGGGDGGGGGAGGQAAGEGAVLEYSEQASEDEPAPLDEPVPEDQPHTVPDNLVLIRYGTQSRTVRPSYLTTNAIGRLFRV